MCHAKFRPFVGVALNEAVQRVRSGFDVVTRPTALETGSWNTYAESTPPGRSWEQTRDLMREVMTPVSHWVSTTRDGGRGGQQSPLRFVYYRDSQ